MLGAVAIAIANAVVAATAARSNDENDDYPFFVVFSHSKSALMLSVISWVQNSL